MFSITVALANTQVVWTFMYKTKESADAAWQLCTGASLKLSDDFGQSALILTEQIAGALFEDLDQSKLAHIERAMHTERVKIQANRAAMSDPQIKTAMMTRQASPGIFNPVGNGQG